MSEISTLLLQGSDHRLRLEAWFGPLPAHVDLIAPAVAAGLILAASLVGRFARSEEHIT